MKVSININEEFIVEAISVTALESAVTLEVDQSYKEEIIDKCFESIVYPILNTDDGLSSIRIENMVLIVDSNGITVTNNI